MVMQRMHVGWERVDVFKRRHRLIIVVVPEQFVGSRVMLRFNDFCEIRTALGAGQAMFVPVPFVMALVAIHHIALGLRLLGAGLRLSTGLIHGMYMSVQTVAGVAEGFK
jgi:hypothetical protein